MLYPRLTNCIECASIPELLKRIDCRLAQLGNSLYNNISYMLNQPIPAGDILQLIAYKRILMYKYVNPDYVYHYSISMIASKVILLTLGCESKPTYTPTVRVTTTTTTTPCPTTTTTTTIAPITTTTTTSITPTTTSTTSSTTSTTSSTSSTTSTSTSSTTTTTTTVSPTTTTTSTTAIPTTTTTSSSTSTSTSTSTTTTAPPEAGITLSVSNTSAAQACAFYGDPGNEVYYYADDIWYIATGLYQDIGETLFAPGGFWYCDGVYARLWGGTEFVGLPVEC